MKTKTFLKRALGIATVWSVLAAIVLAVAGPEMHKTNPNWAAVVLAAYAVVGILACMAMAIVLLLSFILWCFE